MQTSENTPSSLPAIPGYQVREKIGEGGMGEVYLAQRLDTKQLVAIKVLRTLPQGKSALSAGFLREARVLAALSHPNVVSILDCGEIEGRCFMVIEYVAGSTLRSRMTPGEPWPYPRVATLVNAIAKALTYIHGRDILHLDLKPENVLCDGNDVIKITDFGLALSRVDAWTLSELGLVQGTLDYCSPEQRYGLPIDQRSDLFSLATMTYELLTGQLPGRVYIPCTHKNPALPAAIDEVLHLGLMRDPDERYPVVELFRRDLMDALQ